MAIVRPLMRLGRSCASGLVVVGGGGVAITLVLTAPSLRPGQWLAVMLAMDLLSIATAGFIYAVARVLELSDSDDRAVAFISRWAVIWGVVIALQTVYLVGLYSSFGHTVSLRIFGFGWWNLLSTGAITAVTGVMTRELFFSELLETYPPIGPQSG